MKKKREAVRQDGGDMPMFTPVPVTTSVVEGGLAQPEILEAVCSCGSRVVLKAVGRWNLGCCCGLAPFVVRR